MNEQTHISNVMHEVGDKARYDAGVKRSEALDTNRLIGMLGTLLSDKLSPQEKEEVLEREYNIETTIKRKEEIKNIRGNAVKSQSSVPA